MSGGFLNRLGITHDQLEEVIVASPSLRGVLVGYLAERKLVETYFGEHSPVKPDDHDRSDKGDRRITYKGVSIRIEVKSLQTNSVKETAGGYDGRFQCDASDSRTVHLPNGNSVSTVCLLVGGFDLLAINLFEFGQRWHFAFILNNDLPRTTFRNYKVEDRPFLLQTTPRIRYPLIPPFYGEPWALLDRIVQEKSSQRQ